MPRPSCDMCKRPNAGFYHLKSGGPEGFYCDDCKIIIDGTSPPLSCIWGVVDEQGNIGRGPRHIGPRNYGATSKVEGAKKEGKPPT